MILKVEFPPGYDTEQNYILRCLLADFLGIQYKAASGPTRSVRIFDGNGRELEISADLFAKPRMAWLTPECLPQEPISWWDVSDFPVKVAEKRLPVLYGKPGVVQNANRVRLDVDILGGCFFFLARLEEVIESKRDVHDRFSADQSLSARHGLLSRPIVDEYVEVLWSCLRHLWPGLRRRPLSFRQNLTHDVDLPRFSLSRALTSNVLRRDFAAGASNVKTWLSIKSGKIADPLDTFDRIMEMSEAAGTASAFYFITHWTNFVRDFAYVFNAPKTRALIRRISERGHEIGLHASYNAYLDGHQIAREFGTLRRVCESVGVTQERWGGRQHFLRWRTPETLQHWDDAGLDYDSTLGFADAAGFRCGTCREFPTFNLKTGEMLRLRERPLIAMDGSVIDACYQNLGATPAALERFQELKKTCRYYNGEFTVLWHNNRLASPAEMSLYAALIGA